MSHYERPHGRSQFFRLPAIARSARQLARTVVAARRAPRLSGSAAHRTRVRSRRDHGRGVPTSRLLNGWRRTERHAPRDYGAICPPDLVEPGLDWQRRLTAAGFAGIHWPIEYGGRGLTPEHNAVWLLECARAGVPAVFNMVGFVLAGGAVMRFGTPEQQAQHLRATLATDHVWCQLFSEPGRGQRPRLAVHPRRTRRRPLHRQRPEGVVLRRAATATGAS